MRVTAIDLFHWRGHNGAAKSWRFCLDAHWRGDSRMRIMAIEVDISGTAQDAFKPHLKAEAMRVWELFQSGIVRECYFREDRSNAVLMLECGGAREAKDILGTLPLVKEGLIAFDVIPLIPYPGFSRLFSEEK